jgi:hypothetical protein
MDEIKKEQGKGSPVAKDKKEEGAGTQAVPVLSIYQRINEVRKEVNYLQKDVKVANRYNAVTHDAVTAAVRKSLIDHGVLVLPSVINSEITPTGTKTSGGTPINRYAAMFNVCFLNVDVGADDSFSLTVEAHAFDEGDKAPGKGLSYAVKYAMLKVFNIESGENEESRNPTVPDVPEPSAANVALIEKTTTVDALRTAWDKFTEEERKTLMPVKNKHFRMIKSREKETAENG